MHADKSSEFAGHQSHAGRPPVEPLGLKIYRKFSGLSGPIAEYALRRRLRDGKEDPARIDERRGIASRQRPDGKLIWIHGASVGESLSVLPLVQKINELRPDLFFIVTTGTITSAKLMDERLPPNAIHQFIPLDHPAFVDSFLNYWRPDATVFIESEFWPNLILKARSVSPYMALVNGRVSPKSFDDWLGKKNTIRYVLSAFDTLIAQDKKNAERLSILADRDVQTFGNLKNAAAPLPANSDKLTSLKKQIDMRATWLAASTHPTEENFIFDAHKNLSQSYPNLLTIIAPRHPTRGKEIKAQAEAAGLNATLQMAAI